MIWNEYPYTDAHELNLDWIIKIIKKVEHVVDDFTVFNTMTWAGSWDASKSYVKWSIVQDADGNGFLAVKPVPANVPLDNTEYWVAIANYDALYAAFGSRLDAVENTLDDVVTDVNLLTNRRYVFFLDSYGLVRNGVTPFIEKLRPKLETLDNFYTFAVGGAGWVTEGGAGIHAIEIIQNNYASVPDRDTITDVFMNFGINDLNETDYTAITNEMSSCNTALKTYFPNATVWWGFMGNKTNKSATEISRYITLLRTCYNQAENLGWRICSGLEYAMHDTRNIDSSDHVHPTDTGSTILMRLVLSFLKGGQPIYRAYYDSAHFKSIDNHSHDLIQIMDGNLVTCIIEKSQNITSISISTGSWQKIGELTGSILDNSSGRSYPVSISTPEGENMAASLQIDTNRNVYIYIPNWTNTTITGIAYIRFEFHENTLLF